MADDPVAYIDNELDQLSGALTNGKIQIVEDIPTTALAAAAGTDGAAPSGPPSDVKATLRDILGWTWKPGDVGGFMAALKASYSLDEKGGARVWEYTPTGTAIRADLGAVSGAQAVILQQLQAAEARIVPELESIPPLTITPDPQKIAAYRAIVSSDVHELASAFARIDGPTITLIDSLWEALVGNVGDLDPEQPDDFAHLGEMKEAFGFDRALVNTVEQELILSRWLAIVSELMSLKKSYEFQRGYFIPDTPGKPAYLGTSLIILSQWLEIIGGAAREFRAALRSHFIEEAEEDRIPLRIRGTRSTLGAVLDWVEGFPQEALAILKQAGREGARSLAGPLQELHFAVKAARPPLAAAPYLYNSSPIVRSTEAVLEQSILETWRELLRITGEVEVEPDLWIRPLDGSSPVERWQPVHVKGAYIVALLRGTFRADPKVGLRVRGTEDIVVSRTATKVGNREWQVRIPFGTKVGSGTWELVLMRQRKHHPIGVFPIE